MKEKIFKIIKDLSNTDIELSEETLLSDIGINSLKLVTLIVTLEEELNVQFDDSDLSTQQIKTIGNIIVMISKVLK